MNAVTGLKIGAAGATAFVAGWAGVGTLTWLRYGRQRQDRGSAGLIDTVIPEPEVDELHHVHVDAPADVTFAAAEGLDLQASPVNAAIVALRTLPARLRGEQVREAAAAHGLLAETRALGWAELASDPGRELVMGAVCQPWEGEVVFRPLPPDEFKAFDEPGYAKIAWTLEVEPDGETACTFRTRTRVATTDPESRRLFRRYWSIFSPGILLIRLEMLRMLRTTAARQGASLRDAPAPA
jgi:hypothetical protein